VLAVIKWTASLEYRLSDDALVEVLKRRLLEFGLVHALGWIGGRLIVSAKEKSV
jgi:hypothetical protein